MAKLERFSVATELAKARRNYVTTEQFYVAIELARVGRISISTKDFYVMIELAMTESFAAHDRVGRAKAGAHDSVAPCCVATEEAMRARQTRLGVRDIPDQTCATDQARGARQTLEAHNRGVCATREFCRDKLGH